MRRLTSVVAAIVALGATTIATSPTSFAATGPRLGEHCIGAAGQFGGPPPSSPVCFNTYAESVDYLTGGAVELAADAQYAQTTPTIQSEINAFAASTQSIFVLSIEYIDTAFGGSTYTFTGATDCVAGDYYVSSMPSGWNNVISSAKAYSSCWALHYDNAGATATVAPSGASINCYNTTVCSDVGAMNDRTSSMRWI